MHITIWDNVVDTYQKQIKNKEAKSVTLIITSGHPKTFSGFVMYHHT